MERTKAMITDDMKLSPKEHVKRILDIDLTDSPETPLISNLKSSEFQTNVPIYHLVFFKVLGIRFFFFVCKPPLSVYYTVHISSSAYLKI